MRRAAAGALAIALTATATAGAARAGAPADPALASLPPASANGVRPGPAVLYAPAPVTPQFENRDARFVAPPLLVSGTEAYRSGEYEYQGYLYADHGAGTNGAGPGGYAGQLTYPTDTATYGNNAANLVEFRVSTVDPANVVYRFTLNTLLKPATTIVALAFDADRNPATGCSTLPHDPGAPFPGTDEVLTTWGTGGDWAHCIGGRWSLTPLTGREDLDTRQLTVAVPRSVADPRSAWNATLAAGLYDGKGGWLIPQSAADATHPGGKPSNGAVSGIFDLGFRFNEPASSSETLPLFSGVGDGPDTAQAAALAANRPIAFQHAVDFAKLDSRGTSSTVPPTGVQVRILASRAATGQGIDGGAHPLGQLEPYTVRIPPDYAPGRRTPFTLALHSLGDHNWQYTKSEGLRDWSDRHGSIVAVPEGRGPDLMYVHGGEYDVFEVWNDVARHFALDPNRTAVLGYSMGGLGTNWLGSLYPDLFAKAYEVVGGAYATQWLPPFRENSRWDQDMMLWIENFRNLPVLEVHAGGDEYGGVLVEQAQNLTPGGPFGHKGLQFLGYRYEAVLYPAAEHLTLAGAGYDVPEARPFLNDTAVHRDVPHVTFSYLPMTDDGGRGLVHDHAYWVSGVKLADPHGNPPLLGAGVSQASGGFTDDSGTVPKATIDAVSSGFGAGDPTPYTGNGAGVGPSVLPYVDYWQRWSPAPKAAARNAVALHLTNVGDAHYDLAGAHLRASDPLTITASSTAATVLHLDGRFPRHVAVRVDGLPAHSSRSTTGIVVSVPVGDHQVTVTK